MKEIKLTLEELVDLVEAYEDDPFNEESLAWFVYQEVFNTFNGDEFEKFGLKFEMLDEIPGEDGKHTLMKINGKVAKYFSSSWHDRNRLDIYE